MSHLPPPPSGQVPEYPWKKIAQDAAYRALVASKVRFILPATLFFSVYYFTLPILVGYWPEWMKREVMGPVNLAYLFAFSQFFMAWILAGIYVLVAASWDRKAREVVERIHGKF
jgi:uncharacterized membrane protein (DUF485 family)